MTENPFCGFACYAAWQRIHRKGVGLNRVQVTCATCGSPIEKVPSTVKPHNFCDRACFAQWRASPAWGGENNPAWLGGHIGYRGENWVRQRRAARGRDNDTCQRCGTTKPGLPVHHIRPFRLFSDYRDANVLNNLITLCPTCHSSEEADFWKTNPELLRDCGFPDRAPIRDCRTCGKEFAPRSGATLVCDDCCTSSCAHCGSKFYSRKATFRAVKYCSRTCRNAAIRRALQVCEGCGTTYEPDRPGTRFCSQICRMVHSNPRRNSSATT